MSFSRRGSRPSFLFVAFPPLRFPRFSSGLLDFLVTASKQNEGRQNADRRTSLSAASRMRRRAQKAERARLSAFHRGFCPGDSSSQGLSIGPGFLGPGRHAQSLGPPSGGGAARRSTALHRGRTCPSPASTSHAGRSTGSLMPEPPGDGPYLPVRRTALALDFRNTFAKGVLRRARFDRNISRNGD